MNIFGEKADKLKKFIEQSEFLNINAYNGTNIKEEGDHFVEKFWLWKSFSNYLNVLLLMILILTIMTYAFRESKVYIETLGYFSSLIEAALGFP